MSLDASIASLLAANRPLQLDILRTIVRELQQSPVVTSLLVRGSFTTGRSDRSSDVDLVVCVQPSALPHFVEALDPFVRTRLGGLFRGWRDAIAPDLGGIGFVFLVPFHSSLYELDVYVAPAASVGQVEARGAMLLFERPHDTSTDDRWSHIIPTPPTPDSARDLIIEILVLFHLLSKRVVRGHALIVYGHSYLLHDSLRRLIKHQLAPHSKHWGWYYLEDDLPTSARGRRCLSDLMALVSAPPIRDGADLRRTFARIDRIVGAAAPATWAALSAEVDAYRYYLGV